MQLRVSEHNSERKINVLKAIPGNYPSWIRSIAPFWWNLCIFPAAILNKYSLQEIVAPIFEDLEFHLKSESTIYDTFKNENFQFTAVIAAVTGDLEARTILAGFANSTLSIFINCYRRIFKIDLLVSQMFIEEK